MERITSHQVVGLMEAYNQVHAPQINEEQVWEEVESWVNSLLEEGYDLSDYTWEEMYEQYLSEAGFFQGVGAGIDRAGSVVSGASRRASDAVGGAINREVGNAQRAGNSLASFANKDIKKRVSDGQAMVGNAQRAVGGAINAAGSKIGQEIEISRKVGSTPAPSTVKPAPAPGVRPAAPAPSSQYTSKNLGGAQYGAFKAGGGDAAIRQGRSAGEVVAQGRKNISKVVSGREMNVTAPGVVKSSFDMFDVVLGHLIDEGYADTEEAALKIMTNMSEEWKESIVEAEEPDLYSKMFRGNKKRKGGKEYDHNANKYLAMKNRKDSQKTYDDDMGRNRTPSSDKGDF